MPAMSPTPQPAAPRRRRWQAPIAISANVPATTTTTTTTTITQLSPALSPLEEDTALQSMVDTVNGGSTVCYDQFESIALLGEGQQGKVLLVRDKKNGDLYARKEISIQGTPDTQQTNTMKERLLAELRISTECPYVVQAYNVYVHRPLYQIHIILEYMTCGSLADVIKELGPANAIPEDMTASMLKQVLHGLHSLHTKRSVGDGRFMHRDIKPENVLLSWDGTCKLADF
eukprot:Sspe_Gene.107746::Locus_86157_Transcript_1_1_Confidence_1.000_Length_735::g.107746::m.107746/K04368/MAP2K1, MEK1; mitogen-activated protein kinase kinase 1